MIGYWDIYILEFVNKYWYISALVIVAACVLLAPGFVEIFTRQLNETTCTVKLNFVI